MAEPEVAEEPGRVRKAAAKKAPAKKASKRVPAKKAARKSVRKAAKKAAPREPADPAQPPADPDAMVRKAYRARVRCMPWENAMRAGRFPSIAATQLAVSRYMAKLASERSQQARAEDMAYAVALYEHVISKWITKMESGDANAAAIVLKARSQLDKIQKLDESDVAAGVRTIVVAGTEESYVAALRRAARAGRVIEGTVIETADDVPALPPATAHG